MRRAAYFQTSFKFDLKTTHSRTTPRADTPLCRKTNTLELTLEVVNNGVSVRKAAHEYEVSHNTPKSLRWLKY